MASKAIGISFAIGASVNSSVASAFASVQSKLKATQQAFRNASRQSGQLSEVAALRERRDAASARAQSQLSATGRVDASLRRELQKLNLAYVEAAKKAEVYGQSLAEINRRQREMAKSVEASQLRIQRLSQIQGAKSALNTESGNRRQAVASALEGAAAAYALAAPLKIGLDFEAAMSEVKAISGATGQAFADLSAQARELGATTVWSAKEAAQGMKFLSMAGFSASQTMAAMPGMLSLASAGAMDLASTADIASNVLSGFGMEAERMNYVADVMAKTFTRSNTSISSIGESMKYCAPAAKAAGQSFQDVAAMIGKLGDAGIQGSMAGTALNAIMMRMASPPKMAADAMDLLGLSMSDADDKIRAMPDVLREMGVKMSQMPEIDRVSLARRIFGMENAKAGLVLMEQAMSGALQDMSKSLHEEGYAQKVAREQTNNLAGDLKALNSASEEVAICFYDTVSPALRQITQGVTPIVQATGEWIKANPRLTQGLMLLGGAFVALKAGALAFTLINSYRRSFSSGLTLIRGQAREAVSGAAGAFGRMRAELMRPVAVSFSSAQAGAASFRARLSSLASSARRAASSLRGLGPAAIMAGTKAAASGAIAATGRAGFNALRLGVRGVGMAFKTMFGPVSLIMMALSLGAEWIMENWGQIQPFFASLWEGVKGVFNSVMGWLQPIFDKIMSFISPLTSGVKAVGSLIGKGWDAIFGGKEPQPETPPAAAPEPAAKAAVMPLTAQERAQAAKYANAASAPEKKEKRPKKPALAPIADDEPDDLPQLPHSRPASRGKKAAPQGKAEIVQPQIQVELAITQNGIPDAEFAQGVINAIKSRRSELEAMISAIVNEQARLAYG